MRSRQRVVALFIVSALFGVLVAGVGAHGGNYDRRYFRFTKPSWSYGGYRGSRGRDGGGPVRQFGNVGKRATDFEASRPPSDSFFDVRSVTGGGDPGYNGGDGFPLDYYGGGGGGGFPWDFFDDRGRPGRKLPGGDSGGPGRGGQNIEVAEVDDAPARNYDGAPSKGTCPTARISCTVYRTRVEHCATDGDCGSRRRCCFDACVQSEVCKTPI